MPVRVDETGNGFWDKELNDPDYVLPSIIDLSGDTKPDVDLRVSGSTAVINGATFSGGILNAGTGNFNDFLGVQNNPNEYGFNSDFTDPSNPYIKTSTNFTHTIKLSDIAITTIGNQQYYDFRLDVNESNSDPTMQQISLDTFKLYVSSSGLVKTLAELQAQTLVYDIDDSTPGDGVLDQDISVLFTDAYSSGSGRSDLSVLVPVEIFAGNDPATTYLYLYSAFGFAGSGYETNATFEEWRTQNAVTIKGTKFNDANNSGTKDGGEGGVGGIRIYLYEDTNKNGVLDAGDKQLQSTTTDVQGNYTFYGVKTDTRYFIDEQSSPDYTQTTGDYETIVVSKSATVGTVFNADPIGNFFPIDLSGKKFLDLNGDGQTTGDAGLDGVTIFIDMDGSTTFTAGDISTITAGGGLWSFSNLASTVIGKFVYEVVQPGYYQTLGQAGYQITGDATGLNFANTLYGRISGTKTEDLDGVAGGPQGAWTYGAVTIQLLQNGVVIATTQTDASGNYSFENLKTGTYQVRELDPAGNDWEVVGTATVTATGTNVSGFAADVDFSNVRLGKISGTKTEDLDGVAGGPQGAWTYGAVTIELVQGGVVIATTTTDASGNYQFTDLLPGSYTVREVTPTGSVVVGSATVDASGQTATSGFNADVDFSNVRYGKISGTKTEDLDGVAGGPQGAWTYGAVTIELVQGGVVIATTTTDANGNYQFTDLLPGSYTVREVTPAGSVVVGSATVDASGQTATSGFNADVDFSNVRYGKISGTKTEDLDGVVGGDQGAWTYGAVTIELVQGGVVIATTTTDANGNYQFTDLLPGSYTVREVTPAGSVVVGSATVDASGQTATSGFNADVDFSNFRLGKISGTKTEDLDGAVGGETVAWTGAPVTIELYKDGAATPFQTTQTDANGNYSFSDLPPGQYVVKEVTPSGSVVVGSGSVNVDGNVSGFNADVDFVNFVPKPAIAIEKYVSTNVVPAFVDADAPTGSQASTSSLVNFKITLTNTGNVALTSIAMTDFVIDDGNIATKTEIFYTDPALNAWVDLNRNGTKDAGEDWITVDGLDGAVDMVLGDVVLAAVDDPLTVGIVEDQLDIYYSLNSRLGQHENTASVVAEDIYLGIETAKVSDDANYYVLDEDCVGVGTPGFWSNNGFVFWDGNTGNEGKHAGQPGFAEGELTYAIFDINGDGLLNGSDNIDTNRDGSINEQDKVGLLIGDYNQNGVTDNGEDTIFIGLKDAQTLINASNRQTSGGNADGVWILGRDVVASWLNFLANNPDEGQTDCFGYGQAGGPAAYLNDAIDWLQTYADKNGDGVFDFGSKSIKTSSDAWQKPGVDGEGNRFVPGSAIHGKLDEYNNYGTVNGVEYCCDRDDATAIEAMKQIDAWQDQQASLLGTTDLSSLQDQSHMMYTQTLVAV